MSIAEMGKGRCKVTARLQRRPKLPGLLSHLDTILSLIASSRIPASQKLSKAWE